MPVSDWARSCELPFARRVQKTTAPPAHVEPLPCAAFDPFPAIDATVNDNPILVAPAPGARLMVGDGHEVSVTSCRGLADTRYFSLAHDEAAGLEKVLARSGAFEIIGTLPVHDLALVTTAERTIRLGRTASLKVAPGVRVIALPDGRLQLTDVGGHIEASVPRQELETGRFYQAQEPYRRNGVPVERPAADTLAILAPETELLLSPGGAPFARVVRYLFAVEVLERARTSKARVRITTPDIVLEGWVSDSELRASAGMLSALDSSPPTSLAAGTLLRDRPAGCVVGRVVKAATYSVRERRATWAKLFGTGCGVPLWVEDPPAPSSTSAP
jgi:hypothetical protein